MNIHSLAQRTSKPYTTLLFSAAILLAASVAWARPAAPLDSPRKAPPIVAFQPESAPAGPESVPAAPALFADTTYFGGTTWNADSLRWEAVPGGTWTFDSGVGSNFNHDDPDVYPLKDPSRHAYMEGWVGVDKSSAPAWKYFRRMSTSETSCVGSSIFLGGNYSLWAGVTAAEAAELCYAGGEGYGNNWSVVAKREFVATGGAIDISFFYHYDLEPGFDVAHVIAESSGGVRDTLWEASGYGDGADLITFYPFTPGPFTLEFRVKTDGIYSDEDGGYDSFCGALAIDNITVEHGISSGPYFTDFETDDGGWVVLPGSGPGDYSDIVPLATVDTTGMACADLQDTVLVFVDDAGGHPTPYNNLVLSPVIDLQAAGVQGYPRKWLEFDMGWDLPVNGCEWVIMTVEYAPGPCGGTSYSEPALLGPFYSDGWQCGPTTWDMSSLIPEEAERVRVGIGVYSQEGLVPCTIPSNNTPWIDNVRFGVSSQILASGPRRQPRDTFPTDGTLGWSSPARVDASLLWSGGAHGDTAVVNTVVNPIDSLEVEAVFAVDPGPHIDSSALSAWLTSHPVALNYDGATWYSARMDTAEQGGVPSSTGAWMTAYHELDPNFQGSDTDLDPGDPGHLLNDIFPDDLFTPGTRLRLFYRARTPLLGNQWRVWPDTSGANYVEMEVLPSSLSASGTQNSILYVDAADQAGAGLQAQPRIEAMLGELLPSGGENAENAAWDRMDLSILSFEDLGTSATLAQLQGYDTILWIGSAATYTFQAGYYAMTQADAGLLESWLTGGGLRHLYVSGPASLGYYMDTDGGAMQHLLKDVMGVNPGVTWETNLVCESLTPAAGAPVADIPSRSVEHKGSQECAMLAPADTVSWGNPVSDEEFYDSGHNLRNSSVVNEEPGLFRSVFDGYPVQGRFPGPDCDPDETLTAPTERLREILTYFEVSVVAVPDEKGVFGGHRLGAARPNPFSVQTEMAFELARPERVSLEVFDLQGRLVRTLVDDSLEAGPHSVAWDGRDDGGSPVSAGVYFYRLNAGGVSQSRKAVVLR